MTADNNTTFLVHAYYAGCAAPFFSSRTRNVDADTALATHLVAYPSHRHQRVLILSIPDNDILACND